MMILNSIIRHFWTICSALFRCVDIFLFHPAQPVSLIICGLFVAGDLSGISNNQKKEGKKKEKKRHLALIVLALTIYRPILLICLTMIN